MRLVIPLFSLELLSEFGEILSYTMAVDKISGM